MAENQRFPRFFLFLFILYLKPKSGLVDSARFSGIGL